MTNKELRAKIWEGLVDLPRDYQMVFNRLYCPNNDITIPLRDTINQISPKLLKSALENVEKLSGQFALFGLTK